MNDDFQEASRPKTIVDLRERAKHDPFIYAGLKYQYLNPETVTLQDALITIIIAMSEAREAMQKDLTRELNEQRTVYIVKD